MTADDYFAIQNLIYRYCDRIDRGDFAGIAQLFAHAEIHVPALPAPVRGVAAIEAMYTQFTRVYPETGTPRTRHVTSNVIIEPDGANAARAQSYVLVHQATDVLPLQPIIGGRYYDRFAKTEGAWRFAERRMEMDLFGNLSAHLLQQFGP
jgi:ketosteroid isomerase-like protein